MTSIRFAQLTDAQFQFLIESGELNGCGPKAKWLPVPDWIFTADCYRHDFNYWLGHTEADRYKADRQFYDAMWEDANNLPWYKRWAAKTMAWIYYRAVRVFAGKFFYYAEQERSLEDLEELMNA